ncbi:MAG: UvrB/UvrC motif-containing protein [Veillonellales bacterium]
MLCDECKKRIACMHITKIVNNQKVEKHLCEQCAKENGEISFLVDNKISVHDFLKGMVNQCFDSPQNHNETACPLCGMTYSDFSRNGKIGCSVCYTTFGSRLEPLLHRIHGSSVHTGKMPKRTGGALEIMQQLKRLRQELEQHVAREEYEQAAVLRDEIRNLEQKSSEIKTDGTGRQCQCQ